MKVALVTGANSGFGKLTTLQLAKNGYTIFATMRNLSNKENLIAEAKQLGIDKYICPVKMDVTCLDDIEKVYKYMRSHSDKLDVLINNAGFCQAGFFEELSKEEWEEQIATNVFGVIHVTKKMLPLLKRAKGKVINISSVNGILGYPGMSPYATSKFAIEGLSESLRLELVLEGVFVSVIEPAAYQTNIWTKSLERIDLEKKRSPFQTNLIDEAVKSKNNSGDPMEIALLIEKICKTKKPRFRYPVGKGAKRLAMAKRFLPWSFIEKIALAKLK
ncbi:SDR family NAD(P)-dependent oxidoreductase [Bacillus kwashiorkori]|uniref:SDR family NAD(P)-dependent oxidoreductase n=1 Tax=Bacillus kwashiorkori TaxID=1522318 RepID=UPI0007862D0C|nr:SDR family NAD(P)-dependent oxidoreductase [Bacillus kwashiorkori]